MQVFIEICLLPALPHLDGFRLCQSPVLLLADPEARSGMVAWPALCRRCKPSEVRSIDRIDVPLTSTYPYVGLYKPLHMHVVP